MHGPHDILRVDISMPDGLIPDIFPSFVVVVVVVLFVLSQLGMPHGK